MISKCGHVFCQECLEGSLKFSNKCPLCKVDNVTRRSTCPQSPVAKVIKSFQLLREAYEAEFCADLLLYSQKMDDSRWKGAPLPNLSQLFPHPEKNPTNTVGLSLGSTLIHPDHANIGTLKAGIKSPTIIDDFSDLDSDGNAVNLPPIDHPSVKHVFKCSNLEAQSRHKRRQNALKVHKEPLCLQSLDDNSSSPRRIVASGNIYLACSHICPSFEKKIESFEASFENVVIVEGPWSKKTTHLVCGSIHGRSMMCKRTMKYFKATISKLWILSVDWIIDSLAQRAIQAPDAYEMKGDESFPVIVSRHSRILAPKNLFENLTFFVASSSAYPAALIQDLNFLIVQGSGRMCPLKDLSGKTIVLVVEEGCSVPSTVSSLVPPNMILCYTWLLDCISTYSILPFIDYIVK